MRENHETSVAKSIAELIETNFLGKLQGYRNYHLAYNRVEAEIHNPLSTDININLSMLEDIQTVSKEKGFNKVSIKWNSKYSMESRGLSIIIEKE